MTEPIFISRQSQIDINLAIEQITAIQRDFENLEDDKVLCPQPCGIISYIFCLCWIPEILGKCCCYVACEQQDTVLYTMKYCGWCHLCRGAKLI